VKGAPLPLLLAAWAAGFPPLARAQAPEVPVTALSEFTAVRPGDTFRVAVRLVVPAGWHIGWINPGASGLGTRLAWQLPAGVSGGTSEWPYPETEESGADVINVYRGSVVVFSTFAAAPGVSGSVALTADLSWGICREVCVPQKRTVALTLPVTSGAPARAAAWSEAEAATRLLPMRERSATFDAARTGDGIRLTIAGLKAGPAPGSWVTFFPAANGKPSVVARIEEAAGGLSVTLPRTVAADTASQLLGVLVAAHAPGAPPPVRALAVEAPLSR